MAVGSHLDIRIDQPLNIKQPPKPPLIKTLGISSPKKPAHFSGLWKAVECRYRSRNYDQNILSHDHGSRVRSVETNWTGGKITYLVDG